MSSNCCYGVWGMGYAVWGMGYAVWGLGCAVWGMGYGIWDMGCAVWGLGFSSYHTPHTPHPTPHSRLEVDRSQHLEPVEPSAGEILLRPGADVGLPGVSRRDAELAGGAEADVWGEEVGGAGVHRAAGRPARDVAADEASDSADAHERPQRRRGVAIEPEPEVRVQLDAVRALAEAAAGSAGLEGFVQVVRGEPDEQRARRVEELEKCGFRLERRLRAPRAFRRPSHLARLRPEGRGHRKH